MVSLIGASACLASPESGVGSEYHMSDSDFLAKFEAKKEEIQKAPEARFAPIPPFPFKMREAKLSGWSEYIIRVDAKGGVSSAELVGYSRKEFGNGKDSVKMWRFRATNKNEIYRLRLAYSYSPNELNITPE